MDNVISILQPTNKTGEDTSLLIELLKNERKINLARIENQRRKIVELTASRNELLAQQNGVSKGEMEQLRDHLTEVEENSKKLSLTLEHYKEENIRLEEELECKDLSICALRNRVSELEEQAKNNNKETQKNVFEEMNRDVDDFMEEITNITSK